MKKFLLLSVSIIIISLGVFLISKNITASGNSSINNYTDSSNRPQVVKITVKLSNGEVHQINPKENVAMFWGYNTENGNKGEPAVSGILGTFYNSFKISKTMTRKLFEKSFGKKRTNAIFPKKSDKIILNKKLIRKLWDTPGEGGTLKSFILKKPKCFPG